MASLEVWLALGTLGLTTVSHVIKTSVDKGRLEEQVKGLTDWKIKEEERGPYVLTVAAHDRAQDACRAEVYRDMTRLEDNVNKLISKIEDIEDRRERKEDVQQQKIQEMHEAIVDIKAYIKTNPKIGVY